MAVVVLGVYDAVQSKKNWPSPLAWGVWQALPGQQAVPAQHLDPHVMGVAPEQWQAPFAQLWPDVQVTPQSPQFRGSELMLMQRPPHQPWPVGQQWAFEQVGVDPEQVVAQAPQWLGSVWKSTQPVAPDVRPQGSGNAGSPQAQEPPAQVAWGGQTFVHPPQAAGSDNTLRHCGLSPGQSVVPVPPQLHAPEEQVASVDASRNGLQQA